MIIYKLIVIVLLVVILQNNKKNSCLVCFCSDYRLSFLQLPLWTVWGAVECASETSVDKSDADVELCNFIRARTVAAGRVAHRQYAEQRFVAAANGSVCPHGLTCVRCPAHYLHFPRPPILSYLLLKI